MDRDRKGKRRLEKNKKEKKRPLSKAQEMSWLLSNISARKYMDE